jgi:hypothetical protein
VPRRKKTSENRAIRGGNWNNTENNLRSSNRNNNTPTNSNNNIGFRVARPVSAPPVQSGGAPQQKLPARTAASNLGCLSRAGFRDHRGVQGVRHKRAAKEAAPRRGE